MTYLLLLLILITATYLAVKHQILFTLFWTIFACSYDGAGIVGFLNSTFRFYSFYMDLLLFFCFFNSLKVFFNKENPMIFRLLMNLIICFILYLFFSCLFVSFNSVLDPVWVSNISSQSPVILAIWMSYYSEFSQKNEILKVIFIFVFIQVFLSILIIYLPLADITLFDQFKSSNYGSFATEPNTNILTSLVNLPLMFVNKYLFNGLSHFHNTNDSGFYAIVALIISLWGFKIRSVSFKVVSAFILVSSLFLWGNSGMRGPVVGLLFSVLIYQLLFKHRFMMFFSLLSLFLVVFIYVMADSYLLDFLNYIIPSSDNSSFLSRSSLRLNGLNFLTDHILLGAGGDLDHLISLGVDPHELPLRISCLYGFFPGVLITLIVYVIPFYVILVNFFNLNFYQLSFYSIIFFVSITNNYTCFGLFWILFSYVLCSSVYTHSVKV